MEKKDILLMQEIDRRRIAEELHDTTVQDMIHLSQKLELALLYMDQDFIQTRLELITARKQVKDIIHGIRQTIYDLRPMTFDDIGWNAAFSNLKDGLLKKNPELQVSFDIDCIDTSDGVTAISIYRIVSEACQNVIKHSKADHLWVSVKNEESVIHISVRDDGIGFYGEASDNHFGLRFMRERAALLSGNMDMISNENGTSITIDIPYGENPETNNNSALEIERQDLENDSCDDC